MLKEGILLDEGLKIKSSNLQLLKFIAAMAVIYSHSFTLTGNKNGEELLYRVSGGSLSTGGLAVSIFFFISGLYVAKSLLRVKSGRKYFVSRIKRIFPPLLAVVLVSAFVLGPAFTNLSVKQYFSNSGTYKYLLNGLLLPIHELPGVFSENPGNTTVNGSLWTLPVEFACYIALFLIFKIKLLNKRGIIPVFILSLIGSFALEFLPESLEIVKSVSLPGLCFIEGIIYYMYRDKIKLNKFAGLTALLLLILSCFSGHMDLGVILFLPYICTSLVLGTKQLPQFFIGFGNLSYSIYLLGYPVQQSAVAISGGNMSVINNIIISYLLVIPLSVALFYISEKPFMRKK